MALKINPQKYNWPQKTFKLLKNKFPGLNWSVILMRVKQSEVYYKVLVTKFRVFLTSRGTVTDFWFFRAFKTIFKEKKSHHVSRLTIGYLWEEYEKFWFFIMCHIFSIRLGLSGHSLLSIDNVFAVETMQSGRKLCLQWLAKRHWALNFFPFFSRLKILGQEKEKLSPDPRGAGDLNSCQHSGDRAEWYNF